MRQLKLQRADCRLVLPLPLSASKFHYRLNIAVCVSLVLLGSRWRRELRARIWLLGNGFKQLVVLAKRVILKG